MKSRRAGNSFYLEMPFTWSPMLSLLCSALSNRTPLMNMVTLCPNGGWPMAWALMSSKECDILWTIEWSALTWCHVIMTCSPMPHSLHCPPAATTSNSKETIDKDRLQGSLQIHHINWGVRAFSTLVVTSGFSGVLVVLFQSHFLSSVLAKFLWFYFKVIFYRQF